MLQGCSGGWLDTTVVYIDSNQLGNTQRQASCGGYDARTVDTLECSAVRTAIETCDVRTGEQDYYADGASCYWVPYPTSKYRVVGDTTISLVSGASCTPADVRALSICESLYTFSTHKDKHHPTQLHRSFDFPSIPVFFRRTQCVVPRVYVP